MRQRAARVGTWLASHPVEVVFVLLVFAAFAYALRITSQSYFWADDWVVIRQGGSISGLLHPYNNSLSLISVANDRVLAQLFGFDYTPFRVTGLLCLFAVPLGYFLTTRRQFGAVLAALLALPLLWYGRYLSLYPGELNHNFALFCAIVCAAALNRGRRADWILAAALTLSLCAAGGGLVAAAACLVHNACTRPHLRRWLAVLGPTLLWFIWWLRYVGRPVDQGPYGLTTSQTLQLIRDLAYSAFQSATLGNAVLAAVLIAAFATYGIWAVSRGVKNGANFLAWSVGVVTWGFGLASSRGILANATVFRYRYTTLGLVLLAVVPRRPIVWPARVPIATDRRWSLAAAGVILALGSARGLVVRRDMQAFASLHAAIARETRAETLVTGLGPTVISDKTVLSFSLGDLRAGEMRALFARYGNPVPATPAAADQKLVDMKIVLARRDGTRDVTCTALRRPFTYQPPQFRPQFFGNQPVGQLFLWSRGRHFSVFVRRFGERWVRLAEGRPNQVLRVSLPSLGAVEPWQVRADGACRVSARNGA